MSNQLKVKTTDKMILNNRLWKSILRYFMITGFTLGVLSSKGQASGNLEQTLARENHMSQLQSSHNKTKRSPSAYIQLFKRSIIDIVEDMQAGEEVIATYVSPNYVQFVDGKEIDYKGFVRHMAVQKQHVKSVKIKFIQVIAMDNVVSTIHEVTATKKDGSTIVIKVIGHITYDGDKMVGVDELTFVIKGDSQDQKLGSIQ